MNGEKQWFGVAESSSEILTGDDLVRAAWVQAISQSKTALGAEVDLGALCVEDSERLPDGSERGPIDIVFGDPRLVRGVTITSKSTFESLGLPEDVIKIFGVGDNYLDYNYMFDEELIVFVTKEGELIYVFGNVVTLLENVAHLINDEFLE